MSDAPDNRVVRVVNKTQLAEFFSVSTNVIDAWIQRGCPHISRGNLRTPWRLDLLAVLEWKFSKPEPIHYASPDDMPPKERRDWYAGEKARVEVENRKADLISRDEFNAEKTRIKSVLAECLDQLPDKLTAACGLSPAVAAVLRDLIDRERAALATSQDG